MKEESLFFVMEEVKIFLELLRSIQNTYERTGKKESGLVDVCICSFPNMCISVNETAFYFYFLNNMSIFIDCR